MTPANQVYEIEQKYFVDDETTLQRSLGQNGWQLQGVELHEDDYFNHPCKDFAVTGEALRIRKIDGVAAVTYKAAKLPGSVKARQELEWSLSPADADGQNMDQLLQSLGFIPVATVRKRREIYWKVDATDDLGVSKRDRSELVVVIDTAEELGVFAEIEAIVDRSLDSSEVGGAVPSQNIEKARHKIVELATKLGLQRVQTLSYLRMLLAKETAGG